MQSDRGTHFVNELIQRLTKRFKIKHSLLLPYHPQSNGLVERFNKTLCEGIAKLAEEVDQWDRFIQPVLFAYRTKELRISKQSSYMLVYGREPTLVMDYGKHRGSITERLLEITEKVPQLRKVARRAIRKSQAELDRKFEGMKIREFQKGELVWYFDKPAAMRHDIKFQPKWKGPYQISAILDKGAYRLTLDRKELRSTVNGNLLKPYHDRSTWELIVIV